MVNSIACHANAYAWKNIINKQSYANCQGAWVETNVKEIMNFIALLIYQGLVRVNTFTHCWSTKSLHHGLWARIFMPCECFKSLLAILHVVDPFTEDPAKKLRKVHTFIEHFRSKCKNLFQPHQNIAIDEWLVRLKHHSGIRKYIANKPVKFGLKLWVLADSVIGYIYNFLVYTGKSDET